jgi:hypothetical protein
MELWSTSKPGGLVVINLLVGHPVIKRAFLNYCAPFALLLVCCCTGAQIEANRIKKVGAETLASANTCSDNIFENPKYAPIASKTDLSRPNNITLQMLNDKTSPNKQEIALLYAFHGEMQDCRKIALDGVSKMHPLYMLTLVENYAAVGRCYRRTPLVGTVQRREERFSDALASKNNSSRCAGCFTTSKSAPS